MGGLRRAEAALVSAERVLAGAIVTFMVALAFAQVVLRLIGERFGVALTVLWGDLLLRHLVLWIGFLGAALAAASDRQFAMDAGQYWLVGRKKTAAAVACHLFAFLVCVGLLHASWRFLLDERSHAEALFSAFGFDVQGWWLETAAPIGFGLLAVHYALKTTLSALETAGVGPAS